VESLSGWKAGLTGRLEKPALQGRYPDAGVYAAPRQPVIEEFFLVSFQPCPTGNKMRGSVIIPNNQTNMHNRKEDRDTVLSRRDFGKLTMAAFGGVLMGTTLAGRAAEGGAKHDAALLLQDKHVCRGLNTCKGKGKGGDNSCAGTGKCAIADAHSCKGDNACKGQGGCGEYAGQNSCKSLGECSVPLDEKTWKKARKAFEAQM
jgi:hypothetical protein